MMNFETTVGASLQQSQLPDPIRGRQSPPVMHIVLPLGVVPTSKNISDGLSVG